MNCSRFLIFILSLFCISCTSVIKIRTYVSRPSDVDMSNYKRIAILKIDHDGKSVLSDLLEEAISSEGSLEIIDRRRIDELVQEQLIGLEDIYTAEGTSKLGYLLKADAVIFGVLKRFEVIETFHKKYDFGQDWYRKGTYKFDVTLNITDVQTGKIISKKNYQEEIVAESDNLYWDYMTQQKYGDPIEQNLKNRLPPVPIDKEEAYTTCSKRVVEKFEKEVVSYKEEIMVTIDKVDHPGFQRALAFAQDSRWNMASEAFEKILLEVEKDKQRWDEVAVASSYYNLGVSLEYSAQYQKALRYLENAYRINPTKKHYNQQIKECELDIENHKRVQEEKPIDISLS